MVARPWEPAFPQIEFTACKKAGINTRHRNISSKQKQKHKYKPLGEIQKKIQTKAKIQDNDTEIILKKIQKDTTEMQ